MTWKEWDSQRYQGCWEPGRPNGDGGPHRSGKDTMRNQGIGRGGWRSGMYIESGQKEMSRWGWKMLGLRGNTGAGGVWTRTAWVVAGAWHIRVNGWSRRSALAECLGTVLYVCATSISKWSGYTRVCFCEMCYGGCWATTKSILLSRGLADSRLEIRQNRKGQEKGHVLEAISKQSQDPLDGRIFDNQIANHHSETGGQSSVVRQETVLIILWGFSLVVL